MTQQSDGTNQNVKVKTLEPSDIPASVPANETDPSRPQKKAATEFDFVIEGAPDYSRLELQIPANGKVRAEASAMVAMDTNVSMKTKMKGGIKRLLTSESLFINEFTAEQHAGSITFASGLPGDIKHYYLDGNGESLFLQSSSYLASGPDVETRTKYQGLVKGFFSGAGLFLIKCDGKGDIFFSSYGSIIEIDVKDDYMVDNNHIVAFTEGLTYDIKKMGGYKSFFFSGEGLLAKFKGEGTVWIQTRCLPAFAAWVYPFRPKKSNN